MNYSGYNFSLTVNYYDGTGTVTVYDGQDTTGTVLGNITTSGTTISGTSTTGYLYLDISHLIISNGLETASNMTINDFGGYYIVLQLTGDNASGVLKLIYD